MEYVPTLQNENIYKNTISVEVKIYARENEYTCSVCEWMMACMAPDAQP